MQNVILGVFLGMALQAGICAILSDAGLIKLTPTQQASGALLYVFAMLTAAMVFAAVKGRP